MNLGDGGRGYRVTEFHVKLRDRTTERAFDIGLGGSNGKEIHAVLQTGQIFGKVRANHIRPGRQELAHLDIGRAKTADSL